MIGITAVYKFADDGTVIVSGNKFGRGNGRNEDCDGGYRYMDETENGDKLSEGQNRTHSFFTGSKTTTVESETSWGKSIQFTSATKVLGVCIDKKLSFDDHKGKLLKKMCNRLGMITKFTDRTNGLNHQVIQNALKLRLFRFSSMGV